MDVTVTTRPQQSEPMQMPGCLTFDHADVQGDCSSGGANPLQKPPVFIECGSANSFELSPRFANLAIRGSRVGKMSHIVFFFKYFTKFVYINTGPCLFIKISFSIIMFFLLQEHVPLDVESELREAMSDTVQKTADGEKVLPFPARSRRF